MSFGRLKTRLRALINRKDFTSELAGDFALDAMSALERDLRIGPMEVVIDKSDWTGDQNAFLVPSNYLESIRLFKDNRVIEPISFDAFIQVPDGPLNGRTVCTRVADRWLIKPFPAVGEYVYLHYYGETPRPISDEDSTIWTDTGFLATLYKAAEFAADFFQMEPDQVGLYASKAQEHAEKIAGQSLSEAWSGNLSIPGPSGIGEY